MNRTINTQNVKRTIKSPVVTICTIVSELQKKVQFTPLEISQSQASRINTKTGPYFKYLVRKYYKGDYCDDLNYLGIELKTMLKQEASYQR